MRIRGKALLPRQTHIASLVRHARGVIALTPDDIWLTSYPKAGNTWVRFFICNLISLVECDGRAVDFHVLDSMMPALGYSDLRSPWPYKVIDRPIKTHRAYIHPLLARPRRTVYIARDPRDIMVSYYHFCRANRHYSVDSPFQAFIRDSRYGLESCMKHFLSWQPRITLLLHYEQLNRDPFGEFCRLIQFLGADVDESVTREAIARSSFDRVRSAQEHSGLSQKNTFEEGYMFARKGRSKQWVEYFTDDDTAYYDLVKAKLGYGLYS